MRPSHRGWKRVVGLAVFLAGLYLMLRWFEERQVYMPSRTMDALGGELGRPFRDVVFDAGDGVRLHGWFFPAEPGAPRARRAILLCHGNGGNISHRLPHVEALLETGVNLFLFDYRGYGRSEGRPTEEGTYLDAQAAYAWLKQQGYRGEDIVLLGESLGGGVIAELALRDKVGGAVFLSTFTSIPDIAAELFPWLPVRWLGRIRYDTHSKLPRIEVPILILHSREDRLIAFQHAERNFAAAREPKALREVQGDHNDTLLTDRATYVRAIDTFLEGLP